MRTQVEVPVRAEFFPPALLDATAVALFAAVCTDAATLESATVGGCMTMVSGQAAGICWVTTAHAYRRSGVGRALLAAALRHPSGLPAVLGATSDGQPLYRSFGFATVGHSTGWQGAGADCRHSPIDTSLAR